MQVHPLHRWDVSVADATEIQKDLARRVDVTTPLSSWNLVAGADISYSLRSSTMYAAVVVLRAEDMSLVEVRGAIAETPFAYQPGYLSFREAPALLEAMARIESEPDVILFDGQGIAHPRRLGVAAHVGLWLNRPTVGCAKSRLIGRFTPPDAEAGSSSDLVDRDEIIGRVLRTRSKIQPIFVSPGHRIDLESSVRVTLACVRGYRLPEPTRRAHLHVNALRRGEVTPT